MSDKERKAIELPFSGAGFALERQIDRLNTAQMFVVLDAIEKNISENSSYPTKRGASLIAEKLHNEEIAYFQEKLRRNFGIEEFSYNNLRMERERMRGEIQPTNTYLTLSYNRGLPTMFGDDLFTRDAQDLLIVAAYPDKTSVMHARDVRGTVQFSNEQDLSWEHVQLDPESIVDGLWEAYHSHPAMK